MDFQVDVYTNIHKGQRSKFFSISMEAGMIDCADQNAMDRLQEKLESFREHMHLHAAHEEKFIHPLLSERIPGGSSRLNEEHRIMHQQLDDLLADFKGIRTKFSDFEKQQELVLEFYRAWNRFMAFYFMHIDYEEENVQPSLWKLCTNKELAEAFKQILANQTPEELMSDLEMMLPALNLSERVVLFNAGRANLPPQASEAFLKLAERVLRSSDWAALKSKLMIS
jgi:hemerythrin-like domain-containing protein